ncbi:MAG: glycerol-3-phosphate acyltransferase [Caldilineaceae bacterium]
MSSSFVVLLILSYLSGALPWSVWLGRFFLHVDPRSQADGNPGAANAFRVGGWLLGAIVLLLDFFKAFIPVAIAQWGLKLPGEQLFWVALMPTVGHAFSIFLGFRGGRALVTMFGVWSGLTLYEVPLVMGAAAIVAALTLKNDALRALAVPLAAIAWLLLRGEPYWMVALGVAQLLILVTKLGVHYRSTSARLPSADGTSGLKP